MTLISIILAPISRYSPDVLDSKEKALFYLPLSLILRRTLKVGKVPRTLFSFKIIRLQVLKNTCSCCVRRVNFLHFEMLPPFSR